MWLLAELFEDLPEAGDIDKPKLVFFFDEAHLLFADASKAFLDRIEQTVKLIRSKGVGVFFCTQLPTDIPNDVLSQLGARVQHALRAFTPDDQKALTRTARTYPKSKVYDIEEALTSLGIGEAIVTVLSERGAPTPVAWTRLRPPRSLMAAIGEPAVTEAAKASPLWPTLRRDDRPGVGLRAARRAHRREPGAGDPGGHRPGRPAPAGRAAAGPAAGGGRGAGPVREGDGEPRVQVDRALGREGGEVRRSPAGCSGPPDDAADAARCSPPADTRRNPGLRRARPGVGAPGYIEQIRASLEPRSEGHSPGGHRADVVVGGTAVVDHGPGVDTAAVNPGRVEAGPAATAWTASACSAIH